MKKMFILFTALIISYQLCAYEVTIVNSTGMHLQITLEYEGGMTEMEVPWWHTFCLSGKLQNLLANGYQPKRQSGRRLIIDGTASCYAITCDGLYYYADPIDLEQAGIYNPPPSFSPHFYNQ